MVNKTYSADEIFEDIANDPNNVLMNIPPEISEAMGWKPGDNLKITVENGQMVITKVNDGEE